VTGIVCLFILSRQPQPGQRSPSPRCRTVLGGDSWIRGATIVGVFAQ
jgi:hypothetical protein